MYQFNSKPSLSYEYDRLYLETIDTDLLQAEFIQSIHGKYPVIIYKGHKYTYKTSIDHENGICKYRCHFGVSSVIKAYNKKHSKKVKCCRATFNDHKHPQLSKNYALKRNVTKLLKEKVAQSGLLYFLNYKCEIYVLLNY